MSNELDFFDYTINTTQVREWVRRYNKTQRLLFLHPSDLEYQTRDGAKIRPIKDTVLNVDSVRLDAAKTEYFYSEAFAKKELDEQINDVLRLGLSKELEQDLRRRLRFQPIFSKI